MIKLIRKIVDYVKNEVHNPLATMTNLSFVLLGILRLNVSIMLGSLLVLLGIGSIGFHWTRSDTWHKIDIVAIYYLLAVLAGWLWFGNLGISIGVVLGGIAHWSFTDYSRYSWEIIGSLGVLCLIPYWTIWGFYTTMSTLLWFGLAFAVGRLADYFDPDQDGKWYDVWHGMWHIFVAIGIYYLISPV